MILMGNHRDAWVYGAGDPSSGTATMLETSRVLGTLKSRGKGRLLAIIRIRKIGKIPILSP